MEQKFYISNDGQLLNADKIDYYVVIDNQSNIPTSYQVVTNEAGESIFIKQEIPDQSIEPSYLEYVKVEVAPAENEQQQQQQLIETIPSKIDHTINTTATTNHEHIQQIIEQQPIQQPIITTQQDAKTYQCYVCKNLFFSIQSVKTHFYKCHPKEPNVIISCECALATAHLNQKT